MTFAGRAHARDDLCFALRVPDDVPRLPSHDGGPVVTLSVTDGEDVIGMAELWVEEGLLASVDLSWFVDPEPTTLPSAERLVEDDTWR